MLYTNTRALFGPLFNASKMLLFLYRNSQAFGPEAVHVEMVNKETTTKYV